jgi:hypothetical protein
MFLRQIGATALQGLQRSANSGVSSSEARDMQQRETRNMLAHLELSYRSKLLIVCSERVKSIWSRRLHQL